MNTSRTAVSFGLRKEWLAVIKPLLIVLALIAAVAAPVQISAAGERKIALVIGNAAYPGSPLANPVNDARAMATKLRELGFTVEARENLGFRDMTRAVGAFGTELAKGGIGLFYFAGHGVQVHGSNFLIPVDADITTEASVLAEALQVDVVLEQMAAAGNPLNIVILDACRNNPFEHRYRGTSGGLAQTDAPKGTIIAFATAPGKVAADGSGRNGLYTSELLSALDMPGLKVEDVFKRVRVRVSTETEDAQIPWESSSLTGDFYFRPQVSTASPAPQTAAPSSPVQMQAALPSPTAQPQAVATPAPAKAQNAPAPAQAPASSPGSTTEVARASEALPKDPSGSWHGDSGSWVLNVEVNGRKMKATAYCADQNVRLTFYGTIGENGKVLARLVHKGWEVYLSGTFPSLLLESASPVCPFPAKFAVALKK